MNKHIVRIYHSNLKKKPDNKTKEGKQVYAKISKEIQRAEHVKVTLSSLLDQVTNGAVFQVGQLAENQPTPEEKRDLKELFEMNEIEQYEEKKSTIESRTKKLKETTLIVIDIDNDLGNVTPEKLIDYIEPHSFYYTFSHRTLSKDTGTKQNALRLIFELNKPVNKELAKFIEDVIIFSIKQKFPFIDEAGGEVVGLHSNAFIFGSRNKDYRVFNREPLEVEQFEEMFSERKDIDDLIKLTRINNNNALDNHELIDMAQFLANKNVYLNDYKEWAGLVLGVFHTAKLGMISEELALKVIMTFDKNREDEAYYLKFNTDKEIANPSTIATFIKLATDNGYKRKHFNSDKKIGLKVKIEPLNIDTYLSVDEALSILQGKEKRILIDSPTGSGKTYSFIEASKEYLKNNDNTVCYFAMPTKALSTQPTETYGLGLPLMGNVSPKRAYESALSVVGLPLVVGTYDKAKMFIDNFKHKKAIVIADEAHKEVLDYDYRATAINGLFNLRNADNVIKFIGLSGTPQEIDLTQYDKVIEVKQKVKQEVFKDLDIVTYEKSNACETQTTELIAQEVEAGNKVLAFINNKKSIKNIQKILKGLGIKSSTVASKENLNQSKTYRYIMEHEKFPNETDVVLATTVIADGINIKNENEKYVCMVVPHYQRSPLFNASTIKQASNRFRNPYKKMLIPYFISENVVTDEKRANEVRLFNFEWKYKNLLQTAEGVAKYTEKRFKNKLNEYTPSIIERISGMYYQNPYFKDDITKFDLEKALQEERKKNARLTAYDSDLVNKLEEIREKLFAVDPRVIRQRTSEVQEKYYQYFPYAFIKQLEKMLEIKANITSCKLYVEVSKDKKLIDELYKDIEEAEKLSEAEKQAKITLLLTEHLYEGYYTERQLGKRDGIFFNAIETILSKRHLKVLPDLIDHCTYEEAIHLLKQVKRDADIHTFKNRMKALIKCHEYQKTNKNTPTKLVIKLLGKKLNAKAIYTADEREYLYAEISKKLKHKVSKTEIKKIANQFFISDEKRSERQRFRTNFRIVNANDMVEEFGLEVETIERIYYSMGGNKAQNKKIKKLEVVS